MTVKADGSARDRCCPVWKYALFGLNHPSKWNISLTVQGLLSSAVWWATILLIFQVQIGPVYLRAHLYRLRSHGQQTSSRVVPHETAIDSAVQAPSLKIRVESVELDKIVFKWQTTHHMTVPSWDLWYHLVERLPNRNLPYPRLCCNSSLLGEPGLTLFMANHQH